MPVFFFIIWLSAGTCCRNLAICLVVPSFPRSRQICVIFFIENHGHRSKSKTHFQVKKRRNFATQINRDFWPDLRTYCNNRGIQCNNDGGNDFQCRTRPQRSFLEERRSFLFKKKMWRVKCNLWKINDWNNITKGCLTLPSKRSLGKPGSGR